ncbi:hypothetical protein [uncultured Bradyrhizobium sp.]|uniref:hypothetical protein n=1 Tax=uncultured Bradyrhizobium sp. TaxID=199684 RepID=UPI0035CAE62D
MRERDQLIEQTLAFVEGVAAARPARTEPVISAHGGPSGPVEPPKLPPLEVVARDLTISERAAIQRRVASFKAHQQKFQLQREEHYNAIISKARASPGNSARP